MDGSPVTLQDLRKLQELLEWIAGSQLEAIERAAAIIAEAAKQDRLVHIIGTGVHSRLATEDGFFRAGGLANVNPILALPMESGVLLSFTLHSIMSTAVKRLLGEGFDVPVIRSINTPDFGVANQRLWRRYGGRVKHL